MKWNRKSKSPQPMHQSFVKSPRESVDNDKQLVPASENSNQMSLGIHLGPKTIDISSATWPKMKRSDSNASDVDVARIVRPQTATLERPRILDVTLLGKIDMSLTRKGLLSISNLCIAPLDNVQGPREAKRNSTSYRENRHGGKTRKWHTPRKSVDDKDRIKQLKNQCRRNGDKTDESWDDEENSVSEASLRIRKVSKAISITRSPSRGTPVRQVPRDKRLSPVNSINSNTNSPRRTLVKPPAKEKRLSPVSSVNSNNGSPSRAKQPPREKRLSPVSSVNSNSSSPSRGKQPPREKRLSPVSSVSSNNGSPSRGKQPPRDKRLSPVSSVSSNYSPSRGPVKNKNADGKRNSSSNSYTSDDNADKPSRKTCRRPVVVKKDSKSVDEVFAGPKPRDEVPEPCRTCGRPEQPERFHSHPPPSSHKQSSAVRRQQDNNNNNNNNNDVTRSTVTKSSVRKPVPIKYRSGKTNRRKSDAAASNVPSPDPLRRNSTDSKQDMQPVDRKSPRSGVFLVLDDRGAEKPVVRSGPRTVLCYLCGREFGTASYPLHEPHCLQRWERENSKLPTNQQRAVPEKPSSPLTVEQWNAFAWEASQANLVPCENCGRTFNPDRLEVHQRSCRPPPGQTTRRSPAQQEQQDAANSGVKVPPAVYCYICGKMFGTRSIGIHEPQCLEKWRVENEKLPSHQKRPEPTKPQTRLATARTPHPAEPPPNDPKLAAAPHVMDCFLCGREFDTRVLNKHEDECIKEWRKWNKSLPPDQRRPEPERPEFKFNKASGNIDFKATMDAIWQEHLESLVPCSVGCGRTFNPDRVAVHERGCKGPKK